MEILLKDLASENALIKHWVVSWGIQTFIAFWNVLQFSRRILMNLDTLLTNVFGWTIWFTVWKCGRSIRVQIAKIPSKVRLKLGWKRATHQNVFMILCMEITALKFYPLKSFLEEARIRFEIHRNSNVVILKVPMMKSQTLTNFSFWFDNKVLTF